MQFVVSGLMNSCSLVTKYIVTVAHVSRITTLALPEQWTMCTMPRHWVEGPLGVEDSVQHTIIPSV